MILSLVVILIVGLIAYMHYMQGLLSGLISVVLALIASAMAMSYYEPLAEMLSGGKFNDTANGICLLAIFALVYLIGRIVFDKFIPGNIRLPYLLDVIGGAVMGLFAGIIGVGLVVIALQSMPFGPSIAGYARYPLATGADAERLVQIKVDGRQALDRTVIDQMKNENLEKDSQGLLLPVDDIVVGITRRLSNGGSLSTGKTFESIHPDLLQELFGQRIGIEVGAKHTASNSKGTQVDVVQVNMIPTPPPLPQMVGEFESVWQNPPKGNVAVDAEHRLVAVTVKFTKDAGEEDMVVRISPSSVRLVTPKGDGWINNFPIGTLQAGKAWLNKADDFLFVDASKEDHGAVFLFMVEGESVSERPAEKSGPSGKPAPKSFSLAPGTFIEIKRLVKVPLDEMKVEVGLPAGDKKYYPMRKTAFYKDDGTAVVVDPGARTAPVTPPVAPPVTPPAADNGWAEAPLEKPVLVAGNQLPVGIGVGTAEADVASVGASGHLTAKQFDSLEVDPSSEAAGLAELPKPGNPIQQLMVPAGKRMVQVQMSIKAGANSWAWAPKLGDFAVVDGAGTAYKPSGFVAITGVAGQPQRLAAIYKSTGEAAGKAAEGVVTSLSFIYLIPADQKATELRYQGKTGGLPLEK